jgi:hypothetical protein
MGFKRSQVQILSARPFYMIRAFCNRCSLKQSVVDFILTIRENSTRQDRSYKFHAEIRWSHGRFCGNPEAKLYKDFPWRAVSFLETL